MHFDAGRYARYLRDVCVARGVTHIDARVQNVRLRDDEPGMIASIDTDTAGEIAADLFIDCTGFRSLLLGAGAGRALCRMDRLAAVRPCGGDAVCARRRAADPVYASDRDARGLALAHPPPAPGRQWVRLFEPPSVRRRSAVDALSAVLEGEPLGDPNIIPFVTGRRRHFWSGNCIALGLAAGFLEPLESTSITLIYSGIERLLQLFPDRTIDPALAADYNRITTLEYERVRDFLLLHYWGARRDEPLWQAVRQIDLPEKLAHKVRMFTQRGRMVRYEWDAFQDPSWLSMFAGLDLLPDRWDPIADYFSLDQVGDALGTVRQQIDEGLKSSESHAAFIDRHCCAPR